MAKKITLWIIGIILVIGLAIGGYLTYDYFNFKNISLSDSNFENKVYLCNSELYGNEIVNINTSTGTIQIPINSNNLKNFDTSTPGKKIASVKHNGQSYNFKYYVVKPFRYNSLNCISGIKNLIPTFYLNETINLENVYLEYNEFNSGYIKQNHIPATIDMFKNLDTSQLGTRTMLISYKGCKYNVVYHVIEKPVENINKDSFDYGIYYEEDTIETTEHFQLNIQAGSYLIKETKEIMEKIYSIEEKVSGLKFTTDKKIEVNIQGNESKSGGGSKKYIVISHAYLFTSQQDVFIHELAHSLHFEQNCSRTPSDTIVEGFASYIECLTLKEIYNNYPELCEFFTSPESSLKNVSFLGEDLYLYNFETKILNLKRDEIVGNSQYEAGLRFLTYLHHRFNDFCGWMTNESFNTDSLDEWKTLMKEYYNTESLFDDFYPYEQSFGDIDIITHNTQNITYVENPSWLVNNPNSNNYKFGFAFNNLTLTNKMNLYINLGNIMEARAYRNILYKDLYINLESINKQMENYDRKLTNLMFETKESTKIELYNSSGELLNTIEDSSEAFSIDNVSFIKLVGSGFATINITYTEEPIMPITPTE